MQLEALLYSMQRFYTLEDCYVLYVNDFEERKLDYHSLDYPVTFIKQHDFKLDTEDIIRDSKQVTFLCDDDIFYQNCIIPSINQMETFSLRLGRIVTNKKQFDYTISLDGNIFRTEDILPLMEDLEYSNPNQLEGALVPFQHMFTMKWKRQCLVGVPHNKVSDTSRCATSGAWSVEDLNSWYLKGYRLRNLYFENIKDVHADIEFNMVSYARKKEDRRTWDTSRSDA